MIYVYWMLISDDNGIKKMSFKSWILGLRRVKSCKGKLCTNIFGDPPPPRRVPNAQIELKRHKNAAKTCFISLRWSYEMITISKKHI